MKRVYRVGEDFFIATAFVSFLIGGVLKIAAFFGTEFTVKGEPVLFLSVMCLLFSIALSLHDLTQR